MGRQIYSKWRSKRDRNRGLVFAGAIGISAYLGFLFFSSNPIIIIPPLIFAYYSLTYLQSSHRWHLGSVGEEIVAQHLEGLKGHYKIFNDVKIPGSFGNIDHVVIGTNGIFAIETKNYKGIIECHGDEWEKKWDLSIWSSPLRSPSKQVKGNVAALRSFIEQHRKDIFDHQETFFVQPIIVFTNEAELRLNNPIVPVRRPENVCDFIRDYQSGVTLTPEELQKMGNLLSKYVDMR